MTNTPDEFEAWCRAHPKDTGNPAGSQAPSTWDQKCVALVFRAGGFWASASSAYKAAVATRNLHGLDTDTPLDEIPRGWFAYFDKAGPTNGHIGMVTGGGNFLSANFRYSSHGTALGVGSIQGYINTGAVYMGASPFFIDTTLDLAGTAGSSKKPLEDDMTPEQAQKLDRLDYVAQQILAGVLGVDAQGNGIALNPNVNWGQPLIYGQQEARKGIQVMLDRPQGIVDVVALAAALRPMVDSGATAEQIAVAVGQHLADDFARVNANIDDQPTTFEITPKG